MIYNYNSYCWKDPTLPSLLILSLFILIYNRRIGGKNLNLIFVKYWNVIDNCCQKDPTFIIIVGAWSITAVVKTQIARLRIRKCWSLYNMEGRRSLRRTSIGKCGILTTGIFLNNEYSDRIYFTNLSQRPFVYRPWWWGITVQVLERIKSLCFTKGFTI